MKIMNDYKVDRSTVLDSDVHHFLSSVLVTKNYINSVKLMSILPHRFKFLHLK